MPARFESEYLTSENDVLDAVAFKHYGIVNSEVMSTVYESNPHLHLNPVVLPAGIRIVLPAITDLKERAIKVKLWGE